MQRSFFLTVVLYLVSLKVNVGEEPEMVHLENIAKNVAVIAKRH